MELDLIWLVAMCTTLHIASSSRRTYEGHQRIYMVFCDAFGINPLAITEAELCRCCLHFALGHSVTSLPSYMAAVANLYIENGIEGGLPRRTKYIQFCKGINRMFSSADEVVRTRALGMEELVAILQAINRSSREQVAFAAQIVVAFFLCLRTEDHVDGKLLWGDVYPQEDGSVEFLLAPGKSVRRYRRTAIAARPGVLSAIDWLSRLAELTPAAARAADQPIFSTFRAATHTATAAYVPLSRSAFIFRFKESVRAVLKIDPVLYAGYSLRRGGVTEMLMSGVPVPMVKRHLGWAPGSEAVDAYYDHHGRHQMRLPTARMGQRGAMF
jgi:hypothetical protein